MWVVGRDKHFFAELIPPHKYFVDDATQATAVLILIYLKPGEALNWAFNAFISIDISCVRSS